MQSIEYKKLFLFIGGFLFTFFVISLVVVDYAKRMGTSTVTQVVPDVRASILGSGNAINPEDFDFETGVDSVGNGAIANVPKEKIDSLFDNLKTN